MSLALSKNHTNPTVNTAGKTNFFFFLIFKVGGSTVLQRETKPDTPQVTQIQFRIRNNSLAQFLPQLDHITCDIKMTWT